MQPRGGKLEQAKSFNAPGTIIEGSETIDKEITERIGNVGRAYNMLKNTFLGKRKTVTK